MLTRRKIAGRREAARAKANKRWEKWRAERAKNPPPPSPDYELLQRRVDRKGQVFRVLTVTDAENNEVVRLQLRHAFAGRIDQYEAWVGGEKRIGPVGLSEIFDRLRRLAVKHAKKA